MLSLTLTLLASFIISTQAIGRAIVTNQCDTPVYLWSVGREIGPKVVLTQYQSYSEVFHRDPVTGGIAIKLSPEDDGIFKPNVSQTIFAYNLDGSHIWYDLSDVFGNGFAGKSLTVKPSDTACQLIEFANGVAPVGSQVKNCQPDTNLELTLCGAGTRDCLPAWSPCGAAAPNELRPCCTHCIGSHHCVA